MFFCNCIGQCLLIQSREPIRDLVASTTNSSTQTHNLSTIQQKYIHKLQQLSYTRNKNTVRERENYITLQRRRRSIEAFLVLRMSKGPEDSSSVEGSPASRSRRRRYGEDLNGLSIYILSQERWHRQPLDFTIFPPIFSPSN